ncbi:hypothetical protein [Acinetobacter baumannii]|uniref:hypothetical protein n=1 Tax=Acinetobacter baumannii TaxID=470 RepID=UPI003AF99CCD
MSRCFLGWNDKLVEIHIKDSVQLSDKNIDFTFYPCGQEEDFFESKADKYIVVKTPGACYRFEIEEWSKETFFSTKGLIETKVHAKYRESQLVLT